MNKEIWGKAIPRGRSTNTVGGWWAINDLVKYAFEIDDVDLALQAMIARDSLERVEATLEWGESL